MEYAEYCRCVCGVLRAQGQYTQTAGDIAADLWIMDREGRQVPRFAIRPFIWRTFARCYRGYGSVGTWNEDSHHDGVIDPITNGTFRPVSPEAAPHSHNPLYHAIRAEERTLARKVWALAPLVVEPEDWEPLRRWCQGESVQGLARNLHMGKDTIRRRINRGIEVLRHRVFPHGAALCA